ncbi:hypothetical protein [Chryseobacterium paridis]|uniref:Uncharacterized protein n=1 Tax=Chryseobacterium paridis TaxID=2800328 RepID=A0ABS1FYE7_9FLAO|nr:hypothetical protein [Chryseobacterium paridis]MBK1897373.1 hypothetical protein [Chryseobacterium paridis]
MEAKEFKNLVLEVTLKSVDRKPTDWITFNDKMNTQLVNDSYEAEKVRLCKKELPIIECNLDNSYFLVTTDRIISIINNEFDEMNIINMVDYCNEYERLNYKQPNGEYPKVNFLCIEKKDGTKFIAKIDSHYPAFFTRILIYNIFLYKTEGRWFLNPPKKNYE